MKAGIAQTLSILSTGFALATNTGQMDYANAEAGTAMVANDQGQAQQPAKRVGRLPQFKVASEIKLVDLQSGNQLNLPAGTIVSIPSEGPQIRPVSTVNANEEKITATFILPNQNGQFVLPEGVALGVPYIRDDGRKGLRRLPYNHSNTGFVVPEGTDFLHVIPTIDYYPGQKGMIFTIDMDTLREDPQRQDQNGRFIYSPTLAFAYQYDWPGDFNKLNPKLVQEILSAREDYTLVRERDVMNNGTMNHILLSHLRDPNIEIDSYGATQINLAGRFGDSLILERQQKQEAEAKAQPSGNDVGSP